MINGLLNTTLYTRWGSSFIHLDDPSREIIIEHGWVFLEHLPLNGLVSYYTTSIDLKHATVEYCLRISLPRILPRVFHARCWSSSVQCYNTCLKVQIMLNIIFKSYPKEKRETNTVKLCQILWINNLCEVQMWKKVLFALKKSQKEWKFQRKT